MSGVLFVIIAGTAAHVLLSPFQGFSPTDEGFILAGSRRIIGGQVPHRDFISVRPVLSLVLHVPELVIGRDWCLWLSRWVFWIEMAAVAWLWTGLLNTPQRLPMALIALVLSAQIFPAMAWHTVDAILLTTAGISLLPSPAGYILIGAALLCRQNFALMIPVVALAYPGPMALLMLVPAVAYVGSVVAAGGWQDIKEQLTAHGARSAARVGGRGYINRWTLAGLGIGAAVTRLAGAPWLLILAPLAALPIAAKGRVDIPAYAAFAAATLVTIPVPTATGVLLLALAWAASLSIGYPWPALLIGPLLLAVVGAGAVGPAVWVVAGLCAILVAVARFRFPYREQVWNRRRFRLGAVLHGGMGISVSEPAFRMLDELNNLVDGAERTPAVVPEPPAFWMMNRRKNPISCDWPQDTEIPTTTLLRRLAEGWRTTGPSDVIMQRHWWRAPGGRPRGRGDSQGIEKLLMPSSECLRAGEYLELRRTREITTTTISGDARLASQQ